MSAAVEKIQRRILPHVAKSRLTVPLMVACVVGVGTGFVVVGFIRLIELCTQFLFGGGSVAFSSLGRYWVILIPVIGGLLVGPIVTFMAPEAKGHGVPEVMQAMALKGGKIRPIVMLAKALASALAIGSGASVGREGPIVQTGAALGSSLGQLFRLSEVRIKNLVACGAAAGISGVFNTPIAGVIFALEVILRDFGARAVSTVVVASVAASVVSRMFLGHFPSFAAPAYSLRSPYELFLYLMLGVLSALTAWAFIATLHRSEQLFNKWEFSDWLKPAVGGILIGVMGFYFPQVFGTGLKTIEQAIHGELALKLLFFLVFVKILATSVSLGSGSSGGVFAPALFIGAVLGGSFGKLFFAKLPFEVAPPGAYALVGMASVFAGAAHAPVTAILIGFEMTGDYQMILPLMIATAVSVSLAQLISRESIYTIKLKDRGIDIDSIEEARMLGAVQVKDAMTADFSAVPRGLSAKELMAKMSQAKDKSFFVENEKGELVGMVHRQKIQELLIEKNIGVIIANNVAVPVLEQCFPAEPLNEAARVMLRHHLTQVPVMDPAAPSKIIGILRSEDVFNAYTRLTLKRDELISRMDQEGTFAGGTRHLRFSIPFRSGFSGRAVRDLEIPDGVVLTSIQRGKATLIPEGKTILKGRDKIWAVIHPQNEKAFREWLKRII